MATNQGAEGVANSVAARSASAKEWLIFKVICPETCNCNHQPMGSLQRSQAGSGRPERHRLQAKCKGLNLSSAIADRPDNAAIQSLKPKFANRGLEIR